MPAPATLLIVATLLPLLAFGMLWALGRRLGSPLAGWVGTAFAVMSFGASLWAMVLWCSPGGRHYHGVRWGMGARPITQTLAWLPAGPGIDQEHPGYLDVGVYVDSLTVAMFSMVTLVAALVNAFSIGYLRSDPAYARFFTILSLLLFSVLGLMIAATFLQLFVLWGLSGFCAFLLTRSWSHGAAVRSAALKTFITHCLGDCLLLIGVGLLICHIGNLTFAHVWSILGAGSGGGTVLLAGGKILSARLLNCIGICLIFGAIARCAQFPLHAWIGQSSEAPAPANAVLYAAVFGASGVYLLARVFPILTPDVKLLLAICGVATLLSSSMISIAHSDIKRLLAYVVAGQLGYMFLGMGVGSWAGALFHLITTGFVSALLFLASGSVIWAAGHHRELARFGGLWGRLPVTALAFAIGVLALAGTPWLAAQYSRSIILADAGAFSTLANRFLGRSALYWAFFVLPAACTYLLAFSLTRCWMLTFWGAPRDEKVYEQARETPLLWTPLLMMAVLSIFAGSVLGVPDLLQKSIAESSAEVYAVAAAASGIATTTTSTDADGFDQAWPIHLSTPVRPPNSADALADTAPDEFTPAAYAHDYGEAIAIRWTRWGWLVGIVLGIIVYRRGYAVSAIICRVGPLSRIRRWLEKEMYFTEMYEWVWGRPVLAFAFGVGVFERSAVQRSSNLVVWIGRRLGRRGARRKRLTASRLVRLTRRARNAMRRRSHRPTRGGFSMFL